MLRPKFEIDYLERVINATTTPSVMVAVEAVKAIFEYLKLLEATVELTDKKYSDMMKSHHVQCAICQETCVATENAYQCYYCKTWLCPVHAGDHFGDHKEGADER